MPPPHHLLPSHTALLLIGGGDAVVMVVALPALAGYLPFAASHSPLRHWPNAKLPAAAKSQPLKERSPQRLVSVRF
jgi:hypothetical protein